MARNVVELFVPGTWRDEVSEAVKAFVPSAAVEYLRQVPADDMFSDTLEYLVDAYGEAGDYFANGTRENLVETVLGKFEYFRSYHGCRPLVVESYFREGLQPLTRERLTDIAFALFEGTIPRDELDELSQSAKLSGRLGRLYFAADREMLVSQWGHYLIYGPESLNCLWRDDSERATPWFHESQERHRTRGTPTIFECDVPVAWIPDSSRDGLASTLVTQFFQLESHRPISPDDWSRNWGYNIERTLPPQFIRGHSHPAVIRDPLRSLTRYRNPNGRCPFCTEFGR